MRKHLAVSILALVSAAGAFAQAVAGLGAVSGTVRDASGAVVPNAAVVISNESRGITRTLRSTDAGVFAAPALTPSSGYSIVVAKEGFARWEAKDFTVQVGQTVDFSVALAVAATTTQVEVTGEAPLVEVNKTGVSQVVGAEQIQNLPINGRRADTFALLSPAVVRDGTFGLVSFRGTVGSNSFLTDGNDTTNSFYQENAGRTRITTQISQDAVQEFQVLSDGFPAEFGRAAGGVINTVTKSGSNAFHGSAYEYFRNRTLNATDRYTPSGINPPEWRHQAGGTLGGPMKKDKLFFFSDFEIVKRNFPGVNRIINSAISADGSAVNPSLCTATASQCAAAINFIQKQMNVLVPRTVSSSMGFGKLDWRPNDRNSFTVQLNAMHWRSPHGIQTQGVLSSGNMLGNNANSTAETRYGKAAWTAIPGSNSVNELRFGWFKDRLSDPGASDLFPSETGPLYISINGATVGAASAYPRTFPSEQRYQIVENFSWTHGAHSAKFGVDVSSTEDWMNQLSNQFGSYSYTNLTSFAKDFTGNTTGAKNYSTFTQSFGNPIQDFTTKDINIYAQDTWKLTPKFTLNYGLRYEKSFLPQPPMVDPNYPATGVVHSPNKDFAPRLSLSYALNDKTVLRAGWGMSYARFLGDGLQELLIIGNAQYQTSISVNTSQTGAPVFPNIVPNVANVPAGTKQLVFAASNFRNPYTEQGTLSIERQLGRDIGLTVSYLNGHGVQIWTNRDLNLGAPGPVKTYSILDTTGAQVGSWSTPIFLSTNKVDSRYGRIGLVDNGGQSWYNALAVQLKKRMSHGLSADVSYTWSHAIDDGNQSGAGSTGVLYFQQYSLDYGYSGWGVDKGSSGADQRHRAVINFVWQPTLTSGNSAAAKYLINGWELSAITSMGSAQPTSASVSASGQEFSGINMAYTTTLNGSGGWSRVPFWPVNSLNIDREYRVDSRLSRNIPFSEHVKGTLLFEAFNVFNTQYNTAINTTAYTASGGVLKPAITNGVSILGQGNASQAFPDGTNARRMQAAFRLTF
jgi:outer membrane receptor protein involved in Fe transport